MECWSCWVAVGAGCAVVPSHNPHDCVCRVATPGTAFALHRWRTSEPLDTFVLGRVSRLFFYRVGVAAGAPRMLSRSGGNLKGHMCHQTTFKIRLDGAWGPAGTRGLGRGSWVVVVGAQYRFSCSLKTLILTNIRRCLEGHRRHRRWRWMSSTSCHRPHCTGTSLGGVGSLQRSTRQRLAPPYGRARVLDAARGYRNVGDIIAHTLPPTR